MSIKTAIEALDKATQGKWSVPHLNHDGCRCGFVFNEGNSTICRMEFNDPKVDKYEHLEGVVTLTEAIANGKLITASPITTAWVKKALPWLEEMKTLHENLAKKSYPECGCASCEFGRESIAEIDELIKEATE